MDDVIIGDNVTIMDGAIIGDSVTMEDGVFVHNNVTIGDKVRLGPRAHLHVGANIGERATIEEWAVVGDGATVDAYITIGHYAYIGAGSIIDGTDVGDHVRVGENITLNSYIPVVYILERRAHPCAPGELQIGSVIHTVEYWLGNLTDIMAEHDIPASEEEEATIRAKIIWLAGWFDLYPNAMS